MKNFLKLSLGSFVFILAFGLFINVASAAPFVVVWDPWSNRCKIITYLPNGTTIVENGVGQEAADGTLRCVLDGFGASKGEDVKESSNSFYNDKPQMTFGPIVPVLGNKNNNNVGKIQMVLAKEGFLKKVDGTFGAGTKTALMKFQLKNKLPASGKFNDETKALMTTKLNNFFDNTAGVPVQDTAPTPVN